MSPETLTPPTGAPRATAREFVAVLFRRRWIIVALFAVVMGVVLFVVLGTPRVYVSGGQVLVRRGEQQSTMQPIRGVPNDWEVEIGSEVETARSWPVVSAAQKILDAERVRPRIELSADRVHVEVTGKTNVLGISYSDLDPRVAERACDALLRAYIEYRQSSQITYPERFFDREIAQAAAQVDLWSARRRDFAARTGIVDLETERNSLITLRGGLSQRRADIAGDLAEQETASRLMSQMSRSASLDVPNLLRTPTNDASIEQVKQRLIEQTTRVARLREVFRDDSPEVVNAQTTLDTLRTMLDREVQARFEVTRSRVASSQANLREAEHDIGEVDQRLARMSQLESESAEIERQISVWQERYKDLTKSSDQARVNTNTVPRVSVYLLNPASPARVQNRLDFVRLGLAPAFSLVVGVGLAFFMDGLDLTVHTASQAEEEVRLPVLATVTDRRRETWRPAARASEPGTA